MIQAGPFIPLRSLARRLKYFPISGLNGLQEPRWHCRTKPAQLVGPCSVAVELVAGSDSGSEGVRAGSGRSGLPFACNSGSNGLWLPLRAAGKNDCVAAVAVSWLLPRRRPLDGRAVIHSIRKPTTRRMQRFAPLCLHTPGGFAQM
jgi:hypothetical protein